MCAYWKAIPSIGMQVLFGPFRFHLSNKQMLVGYWFFLASERPVKFQFCE